MQNIEFACFLRIREGAVGCRRVLLLIAGLLKRKQ
jgi:hypothetical protein